MKLAIISHTQHYKNDDGSIVGWGPTITEINHLTAIFDEIYHVAVLSENEAPGSSLPYTSKKIHFIPLKEVGGPKLMDKFNVVRQIPHVITAVYKTLKEVDVFQLRCPTGMGVYLIPYLTFFSKKKGWYKYAGNWVQKKPPFGYEIQRWFLKRQSRKVTINGQWPNQPIKHLTFENPCITDVNRSVGKHVIQYKSSVEKINFCFVGALSTSKGVDIILESLKNINNIKFGTFHFIGGGEKMNQYIDLASTTEVNIIFHSFISKLAVFEIYTKCHFIVLPSVSEGFPKVIGEAMNYGCVPIVSDVSCIGQYIVNGKNGFLITPNTAQKLAMILQDSLSLTRSDYDKMVEYNYELASKFTYEYYNAQLQDKIINF